MSPRLLCECLPNCCEMLYSAPLFSCKRLVLPWANTVGVPVRNPVRRAVELSYNLPWKCMHRSVATPLGSVCSTSLPRVRQAGSSRERVAGKTNLHAGQFWHSTAVLPVRNRPAWSPQAAPAAQRYPLLVGAAALPLPTFPPAGPAAAACSAAGRTAGTRSTAGHLRLPPPHMRKRRGWRGPTCPE